MEELYINNKRLDLVERSISRTLQINNFREVQDRQANYSNNISIPMTSNNIEVLDFLGITGNTSNKPFSTNNVKYINDGIELISEGRAIIKKTKNRDKAFDLVIYDGAISLQELLGDLTLEDLNLTAYNHNLSLGSMIASFTKTSGYVYSALGKNQIVLERTIPMMFVHTIFDLIFTQKGWQYEWTEFNTTDFKERVFTMDKGFDLNLTIVTSTLYSQSVINTYFRSQATLYPPDEILLDDYTFVSGNFVEMSFSGGGTIVRGLVNLEIRRNGLPFAIIPLTPSIPNTYTFYGNPSDLIEIYAIASPQLVGSDYVYDFSVNFTVTLEADNSYFPVNIGNIIGTMKQIDFVKDVMQRYNLSFVKVRNQKKLIFKSSEELLNDRANAEDWSEKLSEEIEEDYSNPYAQINRFSYNYDDTTNDFGDGIITLDNTNLSIEKKLVTSVFKASVLVFGYEMNYWANDGKPTQDGNRLFKIAQILNTSISMKVLETDVFNAVQVAVLNQIDFTDLVYQNEITRNYPKFTSVINKFKTKVCTFNLNLIDIYNLDFLKLKYLKQTGKYYYLNKISSYRKGKITTVELIEV